MGDTSALSRYERVCMMFVVELFVAAFFKQFRSCKHQAAQTCWWSLAVRLRVRSAAEAGFDTTALSADKCWCISRSWQRSREVEYSEAEETRCAWRCAGG